MLSIVGADLHVFDHINNPGCAYPANSSHISMQSVVVLIGRILAGNEYTVCPQDRARRVIECRAKSSRRCTPLLLRTNGSSATRPAVYRDNVLNMRTVIAAESRIRASVALEYALIMDVVARHEANKAAGRVCQRCQDRHVR
jgi:hypothetical protein